MTQTSRFIAGDWGTSNLRLYLCEYSLNGVSQILETRFGPGIGQLNGDFEGEFFKLGQDWLGQHGRLPVLLSGMVGSTIGWKDAPYLSCPVNAEQLAASRVSFKARGVSFSILAGLKTLNPLGMLDVMRGEELQMLGWMHLQNGAQGKNLFVLPGTHNKWSLVEDGFITNFLTSFTGELFSLLKENSILVTQNNIVDFNDQIFIEGLSAIQALSNSQLLHALFSTRSKQVLGEIKTDDAASYLSGLIIGADIMGASELIDNTDSVTIIGETELSQYYSLALNHFGIANNSCEPSSIAIAGFGAVFEHLI